MLFKGKKGDAGGSMQQVLFYAAELILGALIILGGLNIVSSQVQDMTAKSVANDLELIISTISFSNNDVIFNYPVTNEITGISIIFDNQKNAYELSVFSKQGKARKYIYLAPGINLETTSFANPVFVPIFFKKNELSLKFEGGKIDECSNLAKFSEGTKFRLFVPFGYNMNERERSVLNNIKTHVEFKDSEKVFFSDDSNIVVEFIFSDESFVNVSSNIPEVEALGCYLKKGLLDLRPEVNIDVDSTNKIIISLGKYDDFAKKVETYNLRLEELYSLFIYNSFSNGVVSNK